MSRQRRERREMETKEFHEARSHPPHMLQMMAELVANFSGEDDAYSIEKMIDEVESNAEIFEREVEGSRTSKNTPRIRCYGCGEAGHASLQCPHKDKGLKCFKCNQFGHVGSTCKRSEPRSEVKLHNRKSSSNSDHRIPKHVMFGASQGGTIIVSDCPNTLNEVNENDILTETYVVKNLKEKKIDDYDSDVPVISEVMPVKIHKHNIVLQKPMITININGLSLSVLVDSGCEVNIISSDIYDAIGKPKCNKDNITLSGIGLSIVRSIGKCYLSFYAGGNYYSNIVFHIVSNYIPYNVILGQEFLSNITVVMERELC
ncbi:unnamed protein product, partial [Brenthis ino]